MKLPLALALCIALPATAAHASCVPSALAGKWLYTFQSLNSFPPTTGSCVLSISPQGWVTTSASACNVAGASPDSIVTFPHGTLAVDANCHVTGALVWSLKAQQALPGSRLTATLSLYQANEALYVGAEIVSTNRGVRQIFQQQLVKVP